MTVQSAPRGAWAPPVWMRVLFVPGFALIVWAVAAEGGGVLAVLASLTFGWIFVGTGIAPRWFSAWTRRHPVLDGALLGPLALLGVAQLTSWPMGTCLIVGLVGSLAGGLRGRQRRRGWSSTVPG